MLDVPRLVDPEVGGARPVREPVAVEQALALGPRDLRLPALDRVEADERLDDVAVRGPGAHALRGLGGRRVAGVATGRLDEPVPEPNVAAFLGGMPAQLGALGDRIGGRGADLGDRLDRVPVLARVARQLVGGQLSIRPAAVEGVAEDVPPLTAALNPVPGPFVHLARPFRKARSTGRPI